MEAFDFTAPTSVGETLGILADQGPDARLLAGGQSLMILLRQRLVAPGLVVGLKRVDGLDAVVQVDGGVRIGSTATYRSVAGDAALAEKAPTLARAAGSVGSVHIRNVGTLGGSLCHADPASDVATVLLTLDAVVEAASTTGPSTCPVDDFFTGLFETRLEPDQLLTGIAVPPQPPGATFGYRRFSYREGEYPMGVVAARLEWDGPTCTAARVAVGGGDAHPTRLVEVEQRLAGEGLDGDAVRSASRGVRDMLHPMTDVRGSAAWKAKVLESLVRRTLEDAVRGREAS